MTSPTQPLPPSAYQALASGGFASSALTRGPWHPEHQHAGPPIALVARAVENAAKALGLTHIARLTANLIRPVPIAELQVEVTTVYAGRNAAHFAARLLAQGKEVGMFTALAQREAPFALPDGLAGHPLATPPAAVEDSPVVKFPFASGAVGYSDLVETRAARGKLFQGPCAIWFRLAQPLVKGETPSPFQRVAVAADSGNGISAVLDYQAYSFINGDLTINLLRPPRGDWICLDAHTYLADNGCGLAESALYDATGLIGRSTQSLSVRLR